MLKTPFYDRRSQKGSILKEPFYDPSKSYEENYDEGPFGSFADEEVYKQEGEPEYDFFGEKVYLPFGIPAGPLLNSKFCKGAFEKGFDICVYKTVRADIFPCHPTPNILAVKIEGDLTLEKSKRNFLGNSDYSEPLSITNSFGVPSKTKEVWQEDVKKAISYAGIGQVLVLSFMGTTKDNQTPEEFVEDWRLAAKEAKETGAKIYEANLSCPNIGNDGLVCYDLEMTEKVCKVIREELGDSPLVLKVGFYEKDSGLERLAEIAGKYAQGVSLINTITAGIVDENGKQALPGSLVRFRSGICGAAIKWAGLESVKRLKKIIKEKNLNIKVEGVGGVTKPEDYFEYIEAGADGVMSATGAMWNPELAQNVKALGK